MKSLWVQSDADAMAATYARQGYGADVALRVYSSRLLGADPRLVQHGGGNTSVKTTDKDLAGRVIDVIRVKGSGWDLGDIEPPGLPAMRLDSLLSLTAVAKMSDEAMVNAQRAALLDSSSPTPSVETLLHAWVPETVIDHTHANAYLSLVDQADGEKRARDVYGADMAVCPYVMPGFALAHQVRLAYADNPNAKGAVLLKHGVFTWGDTAREAYERMIEMVTRAEKEIERTRHGAKAKSAPMRQAVNVAELLPALRGALAEATGEGEWRRVVLDSRRNPEILEYVSRPHLERFTQAGPATPDHVLRIKPWPLVLPRLDEAKPAELAVTVRSAVEDFRKRYSAYFERHNARVGGAKRMLDTTPRVVLVPGYGLIGVGYRGAEARIAADVAETNASVIADGEILGPFQAIPESDIFDMEYWSLEQAKLGKSKPMRLAGHVVAVTGGASGIGAATAKAFAAEGADVFVLDRDLESAKRTAEGFKARAVECDVTVDDSVSTAMNAVAAAAGGVDILVSNAGAAWSGRIGEVADELLRQSFELNFFGHQRVAKAAVAIMRRQGTGGCLLFNASKQALNPGPDFGPYGLPKAALIALARQYAIDYGADGIRSNVINADRIRSGLLTDDMVKTRSAARGVSEKDYMSGNLLGMEVRASDVAQAFLSLALSERTTGAIVTVDGGNIAAAVR